MPVLDADALASWCQGTWSTPPTDPIRSVGQDTRTLEPGALYVALPGARVDGHDLIPAAREAGAVAVLCAQGRTVSGIACLEVADPAIALQDLARGYRRSLSATFVGITGSAGKTTVKDLLSAMCRGKGPTCSTPGNWNNFVGLPLSLLRMEPTDEVGVFELGMNHSGEIADLAKILEPEMGCVTSIGEAHLEQLGSVGAIAQEKTSLFTSLPEHGVAVVDADSEWADLMRARCACRVITCSLYGDADVVGHPVPEDSNLLRIENRVEGEWWELPVPLPGEHMRKNVLQAAVLARACGVSGEQMALGLQQYQGSPMRWQKSRIGDRVIINDAYNANPLSMKCAVRAFAMLPEDRPRWAVLGEMAELGPESARLHHEVGRVLDTLPLTGVILVGEGGSWLGREMSQLNQVYVQDPSGVAGAIEEHVPLAADILLKASRAVGLENSIEDLQDGTETL